MSIVLRNWKFWDRLSVLDCYTDPLGWKEQLKERGAIKTPSTEASLNVKLCKDVRNLDDMFSQILVLGKGRYEIMICISWNPNFISKFYIQSFIWFVCVCRTCWRRENSILSCHRLCNPSFSLFTNSNLLDLLPWICIIEFFILCSGKWDVKIHILIFSF